jgi:hypothetical protein
LPRRVVADVLANRGPHWRNSGFKPGRNGTFCYHRASEACCRHDMKSDSHDKLSEIRRRPREKTACRGLPPAGRPS